MPVPFLFIANVTVPATMLDGAPRRNPVHTIDTEWMLALY